MWGKTMSSARIWRRHQIVTYKSDQINRNWERPVDLLVFQTIPLGIVQEDHCYIWHVFNHCRRLFLSPKPCNEAKLYRYRDQLRTQDSLNVCPISLLSTKGKLFEEVLLKTVQRHTEETDLLIASKLDFRARHSTTNQCMRLTDHVTLYFNNNMPKAAVFLDIEEVFATTLHIRLLYKLKFRSVLKKLISFFSFREIQSLGQRWNVYAKGHTSWGFTKFRPVSHIVQST
jgi:hypothetical protein